MGVSSPEVFSGIRVAPSSIFVDHRLSLCPFSFGHHIVRISLFATSYSYKADQVHFKVLVEQELLALHEHSSSPLVLVSTRVVRSFVFCVFFYRSLFVILSLFAWPLYCLSFFDLRIMIAHLVFSNSSCEIICL